jgi:hypothetical protein
MFAVIDFDYVMARTACGVLLALFAWVFRVSGQLVRMETKLDPLVDAKDKHTTQLADHDGRIRVLEKAPMRPG